MDIDLDQPTAPLWANTLAITMTMEPPSLMVG